MNCFITQICLKKFIDQIFWTIYEIIYFIYKIISIFLNITKIKKFIFFLKVIFQYLHKKIINHFY